MLRNKIDFSLASLDTINKIYPWIPNSSCIRPKPKDTEKKKELSLDIQSNWNSYTDYILYAIFDNKYELNAFNKKIVLIDKDKYQNKWIFKQSMFRYDLIPESNHWVLWCIDKDFNFDFPDYFINCIIEEEIKKIIHSELNFQFAWYKNPKPTIPEFYHVQVFWTC